MNKTKIALSMMLASIVSASGAYDNKDDYVEALSAKIVERTGYTYIVKIETRGEDFHSIYLNSGDYSNGDGCIKSDRAVIDGTLLGGKALYASVLSASLNGNQIKIATDGCLDILGGSASGITAPKVINLTILTPAPV